MPYLRTIIALCATLMLIGAGECLAQQPAPPPSLSQPAPAVTAPISPKPAVSTKVKEWTRAQWEALKKRWSKNQREWNDCLRQLEAKKLSVHLSVHNGKHFLYDCMLR